MRKLVILALLMLSPLGCRPWEPQTERELQGCFNNYVKAIKGLDGETLDRVAHFPDEPNYREYVKVLLLGYLDQVQKGQIGFDQYGVILSRFLGLSHHRNKVLHIQMDGNQAVMRIGIHFAYDANIAFSDHEPGTKLFVPGRPWGKVLTITVGGDNEIPRDQLNYAEVLVHFLKQEGEDHWRVSACQVDETKLTYETSYRGRFD